MRRATITALWHLCGIIDRIPEWSPEDRRWYRYGLGCRLGISGAAMRLEQRWGVEA